MVITCYKKGTRIMRIKRIKKSKISQIRDRKKGNIHSGKMKRECASWHTLSL
jgi:hypothetical protein